MRIGRYSEFLLYGALCAALFAVVLFVSAGCGTAPAGGGAGDGQVDDGGDGGDDGDGGDGGDQPDGAALYEASCSGCHGADGAGPPDVRGSNAAGIQAKLDEGGLHAITLTTAEVAAIADFLGG